MGNYLIWEFPSNTGWIDVMLEKDTGSGYDDLATLAIGVNDYYDDAGASTDLYRYRFRKGTDPSYTYSDYVSVTPVTTYASPYSVRQVLPNLLLKEETLTGATGTTLTLPIRAIGIYSVMKNDVTLATTDFTFTRPLTITLDTAATSTDVFVVTLLTGPSNRMLTDIILDVMSWMDAILVQRVAKADLPLTSPVDRQVQSICAEWAAGTYLKRFSAAKEDSARVVSLTGNAKEMLTNYVNNWHKRVLVVDSNDDLFDTRSRIAPLDTSSTTQAKYSRVFIDIGI